MTTYPSATQLNNKHYDDFDWTAKAYRVILINSSGDTIKVTPLEENRSGSDCSGSDGALGRILTLQNTSESGSPVSVWVDDQIVAQADMTISHLSSSSTITFDNIEIYDSQTIRTVYYV